MAKPIVQLAFAGVTEDFIGFVDLFEAFLSFIIRVNVGMVLASETAICALDLGLSRRSGNTE